MACLVFYLKSVTMILTILVRHALLEAYSARRILTGYFFSDSSPTFKEILPLHSFQSKMDFRNAFHAVSAP